MKGCIGNTGCLGIVCELILKNPNWNQISSGLNFGAADESRTHMDCSATPSRWCVYQFRHGREIFYLGENSQIRVRYFSAESVEIARPERLNLSYLFDLHQQIAIVQQNLKRQMWERRFA